MDIDNKGGQKSMDYVYLQGSEEVSRAAATMTGASGEMRRAADSIAQSVMDLERVLEQDRYERANLAESMRASTAPDMDVIREILGKVDT